jgi:hypothetical protein
MTDPKEYAQLVHRVRDAVLSGGNPPGQPRAVVSDSWRRSLAARIDPETSRPVVVYEQRDIADLRGDHPLAAVLQALRTTLVSIADEAEHVMIVTDAEGHILWREGNSGVCVQADRVGITEGTRWSEDSIGTNAMGTALAIDGPVMIHSTEHLVRTYHPWTCVAAPIHDPDTSATLGVIDVTGPLSTLHPATLALVSAAAQLAESQLRLMMTARDERLRVRNMRHLAGLRGEPGALLSPTGRVLATESCCPLPSTVDVSADRRQLWLPDGREATLEPLAEGFLLRLAGGPTWHRKPLLSLSFLGTCEPTALMDGREVPLTLRHAEILTLMALHPKGLTAEQLALELYGESGNPATARAEIHRLRTQLGPPVVHTKPYRLNAEVDADFLNLRTALGARRVREAVATWRGPLLTRSDAPGICAERDESLAVLRSLVIERGDADTLSAFTRNTPDLEVLELLVRSLPSGDHRRTRAEARLRQVLMDS